MPLIVQVDGIESLSSAGIEAGDEHDALAGIGLEDASCQRAHIVGRSDTCLVYAQDYETGAHALRGEGAVGIDALHLHTGRNLQLGQALFGQSLEVGAEPYARTAAVVPWALRSTALAVMRLPSRRKLMRTRSPGLNLVMASCIWAVE